MTGHMTPQERSALVAKLRGAVDVAKARQSPFPVVGVIDLGAVASQIEADGVRLEAREIFQRKSSATIDDMAVDIFNLTQQVATLRDALGEIEWSNDTKWQSDRARAALAQTEPKVTT